MKIVSEAYQYVPLPKGTSIRLLHIEFGEAELEEPLFCRLEEVFLDDSPSYRALSYTWGDPTETFPVYIENSHDSAVEEVEPMYSRLDVTVNLHQALVQLRENYVPLVIWADAICIDQSNLDERSQQVQLMAKIYECADETCIWLGMADEYTDVAFDWLEKSAEQMVAEGEREDPAGSPRSWENSMPRISEDEVQVIQRTFSDSGPRKWWERAWVVQELAYSHLAMLFCGTKSYPWLVLEVLGFALYIGALKSHYATQDWPFADFRIRISTKSIRSLSDLAKFGIINKRNGISKRFEEVLALTRSRKSTNPRDHVYALLGLCTFSNRDLIPEYSKSVSEVWSDATKVMLSDSGVLDPICGSQGSWKNDDVSEEERYFTAVEVVPTWLPNIAEYLVPRTLQLYSASSGSALPADFIADDESSVLRLEGTFCDTISDIAPAISWDDSMGLMTPYDVKIWEPLELMSSTYPTGEPSFDAYIRALLHDLMGNVEDGEHRITAEEIRDIREGWLKYIRCPDAFYDSEDENSDLPETARIKNIINNALLSLSNSTLDGWRLCRTKTGHLGQIPKDAEIEDMVFVMSGSKVPFLLRPRAQAESSAKHTERSEYNMIGTCFLQGIMDGEAYDNPENRFGERETIFLF
ncbi:hypothetical protein VTL71DRAFT_6336 [Oculimacula yallundae]|uniref:Heterokaryon incompatibility domain-containing protein n=1 Tax=Oculimacula yallundae TaxID=86028 RepID=A0ABR4BWN8_9HELO